MIRGLAAILLSPLLLFTGGCDTQCLSETEVFFPPTAGEYRLLLSNGSQTVVRLLVDGVNEGVYCPGVRELYIGNFRQKECSRIRVEFLDLTRRKDLDDCSVVGEPGCLENNTEGRVCFDTTMNVESVRANIR